MEEYQRIIEDVLKKHHIDPEKGLSAEEVVKRQSEYGSNELREKKKKTLLKMFLEQFNDFLVIILLIAAAISIVTGILSHEGFVDGIVILAIVILNSILGVNQENKASNALAALKKMSSPHARVLRDGRIVEIASRDITVGDIVILETGDFVAADIRLIESTNLRINESALTGESTSVEKYALKEFKEEKPLAERVNSVFMSTLVTYGKGRGIVINIGMTTEIGKIATMLDKVEESKTPLQKKITQFAKVLGIICIGVSVLVFGLGLLQKKALMDIALTAIALAVAAIPEGLTAVITVVLALGMQRMVKRHAIIKNLATVETLGQATIICSDKTGTLTQNEMTVRKLYDMTNEYDVTGNGYEKKGDIKLKGKKAENTRNIDLILKICLLCNDAVLENENKVLGDPTEGALLVLAAKGGFSLEEPEHKYPQVNEYTFDSTRKLMSSINKIDNKYLVLTKGASDQLIEKCNRIMIDGEIKDITEKDLKHILEMNEKYSGQAHRVLGYAYRETDTPKSMELEQELIFLGLTAMIDPPRKEAKDAIAECHKAGIKVMMITGDHLITAKAIATELNILSSDRLSLSSEDTKNMTDEEFKEAILNCDVFARSTPADKIRIVEVLQKNGEVVAMTGDGVNDSPALKQAEIGVAMGITGTEVSKEASNMILTDDNFASIVSAVEEGRIIYSNIRKFTIYLVSCNIGEIFIILLAMVFSKFFGGYIPLLAIHLLWINLMTDAFPAFALGMEKGEKNIMDMPPRNPDDQILNKPTLIKVFIQAAGLVLAALTSFKIGLIMNAAAEATLAQARTMIFVTVIFGELFRTYSARSETKYLFKMNPFGNRFVNLSVLLSVALLGVLVYVTPIATIFRIEPLSFAEVIIAAGLGFIPMLFGELTKIVRKVTQ